MSSDQPEDPPGKPEVPLDQLPPLSFPAQSSQDPFSEWASQKRRGRVRAEIYGAAALVAAGLIASLIFHTRAFVILAVVAAAALGVYELLVSTLE